MFSSADRHEMAFVDECEGLPRGEWCTRATTTSGEWVTRRRLKNYAILLVATGVVSEPEPGGIASLMARYELVEDEWGSVRNVIQCVLVDPYWAASCAEYDVSDDEDEDTKGRWTGRRRIRSDSPMRGPRSWRNCKDANGTSYRWKLPVFGSSGLRGIPLYWRGEFVAVLSVMVALNSLFFPLQGKVLGCILWTRMGRKVLEQNLRYFPIRWGRFPCVV